MTGTISHDFNTIDAADATTGWLSLGTWGKSFAANSDIHVQNTSGVFGQVSANYAWALAASAAGLDLTGSGGNAGDHIFFWIKNITWPVTDTKVNGGIRLSISGDVTPTITGAGVSQGPTNSKNWFLDGNDTCTTTGWVCYVVDPNGTDDLTIGSGDTVMNHIDRIGIGANITGIVGGGSIKPYNILWDMIKHGTGLIITLGDGVTAVAFSDIYTADKANANAYGVITSEASVYFLAGKMNFGTTGQSAETIFRDTSKTLVWRDFPVSATFYEILMAGASGQETTFQLGAYNPSSNLTSNGCIIKGSGNMSSTSHPIWTLTSDTLNQVTKLYGCTFSEMRSAALKYNTVSINVTNCTTTIDTTTVTTSGSYITSGIVIGMLVTGTGIDSATYVSAIASATSLTINKNATASGTVTLTFQHTNEVRGCTFVNSGAVTSNGCVIDSCIFQDVKTGAPISATYALILTSTTEANRVTNCKFINCNRAIKITAAGSYDFTNMTFSGNSYDIENSSFNGAVIINNDANSNASTGISTDGGSITFVSSKTLTVTVKDENNNTIQGCQVLINKLTPTEYTSDTGNNVGDGDLIVNEVVDTDTPQSGTITVWDKSLNKLFNYRYSSWTTKTFTLNTAVTGTANTGGSTTTLKRKTGTSFLTADIQEGDTVQNTTDGSYGIVDEIVDADTITLYEPLSGGASWDEDDAYSFHKLATTLIDNDDIVKVPIMNNQTNSSGIATRSYTGANTNIRINVRKSSETTKYQQYTTTGAISSSGLNTTVVMIEDTVA